MSLIHGSIVFVHGFTGYPERTWTHKGSRLDHHDEDANWDEHLSKFQKLIPSVANHRNYGRVRKRTYWLHDLLPSSIPNARVLTYGYDANIRHWAGNPPSQNTVYDTAWDLLGSLDAFRHSESQRPIFFIVHSLGGVVVKEALRRSRGCETHHRNFHKIFQATMGVMLFGTPHGGADPRGILQHIVEKVVRIVGYSVNEQILTPLLPAAERLRELRDEFNPMARERKWIVYSSQEQYGLKVLNGKKS